MEQLLNNTPINWVQVTDPTTGRIYYAAASSIYPKKGLEENIDISDINVSNTLTTASFIRGSSDVPAAIEFIKGDNSTFSISLDITPISASYAQTASYAPAYLPLTGGTINGNVTVNGTASIAFLNVTYESASVIYSSGSNQFGDASNDTQTLWGTVDIKSGPVLVTGSVIATSGFTGSLQGTASYATNALSASYAPDTTFPYTGSARITGSLGVTGSVSFTNNDQGVLTPFKFTSETTAASPSIRVVTSDGVSEALLIAARTAGHAVISTGINRAYLYLGNAAGYHNVISSNDGLAFSAYTPAGYDPVNDQMRLKNGNLGIGTGYSATARLDIKSQGALSTDIALRVRNSADSANLFSVQGNNVVQLGASNINFPTLNFVSNVNPAITFLDANASNSGIKQYYQGNGVVGSLLNESLTISKLGTPVGGNGEAGRTNFINSTTNWGAYLGTGSRGGYHFYFKNTEAIVEADRAFWITPDKRQLIYSKTADVVVGDVDAFAFYGQDIVAGNAAPHFRTEAGNIVKLYTQAAVTSSQGIADVLTNLGFLTGSSTIASTNPFPFTGSAGITGSLTVVGPTTSTQIGVGAAPSGSVPLDVKAQGALSTDLAFRIRNSADTKNIFKIQGDASAALGELTDTGTKTFSVNTYGNPRFVLGTGYSTDTGVISITRRQGGGLNDNVLLLSQNAFADGNQVPYKHQYVNPSSYYGLNIPVYGYNAGFMYFKDSATIANLQMKLSPDNALSIYTSSASPIETIITGSAFQLWASGSLGNAKPYIRTQNGTLLYLGDQSLLYNVTASSITSSFTGSLLGTASYATNAISASYTPLTIGTTAITSGTDTRLLYQNAGVVSQSARMTFDGTKFIYDGTSATANASIFEILGTGGQRGLWVYQDNSAKIGGNNNYFVTKGTGTGQATNNFYSNDSHFCFGGVDSTKGWVHIGANNNNPQAKLDIRAQGALSTDIAFRVRNSANSANLGAIYGNGTVNLGNSNFNFQSTETSGRTAVIGSSNTGASYSTYSILSILGHNNSIASYGHTSYVGINSSINQNSGGTVTGMGESNTLVGGTIGIGMNNNIAGSANSNMNTGIGYNNAIQYEKKNTFLLGNNLRITAAGNASMTKIGWANSAGTLAQIDRSFEVYLNGQSGSDFHVTGKTNVVLKNNSVLVSGTNYEAAATNTLTIHNGVAPITNITGAFQLYSTASTAGNAKPYFRTENGTTVWLGDESRLFNVTASIILNGTSSAPSLNTTANVTTIVGSNTIYSIPTASYDGAWFEYTVRSGSNARAGQIMSIWSGSSVNFTETTTTDFGTTAGIAFTVMVSGSNLILTGSSATAGWTVKTIVRSI